MFPPLSNKVFIYSIISACQLEKLKSEVIDDDNQTISVSVPASSTSETVITELQPDHSKSVLLLGPHTVFNAAENVHEQVYSDISHSKAMSFL